jgi:hypothetical protein
MTPPLSAGRVIALKASAAAFALLQHAVKAPIFRRLGIA